MNQTTTFIPGYTEISIPLKHGLTMTNICIGGSTSVVVDDQNRELRMTTVHSSGGISKQFVQLQFHPYQGMNRNWNRQPKFPDSNREPEPEPSTEITRFK